jgi:hypothetical protein
MTRLLDWLATHVEPYVSFRFLLGLVFTGMFVQWAVSNVLWLRDLARPDPAASERDRQLARMARSFALILILRALSWRPLRAHLGLLAQLAVLAAAALWLSIAVFSVS